MDFENLIESTKQRETAAGQFNIADLHCYGCAHSASSDPYPGRPSGERPCCFCVRNPQREEWQRDIKQRFGHEMREWYDGSPIAFYPMDCYRTLDMVEQGERWHRRDKGEMDWNEPQGGVRVG